MLLADVAATSASVAGTRSRLAKVAALADLLRRLEPAEAPIAVGLLTGEPRQGRIGVGWATALRADVAPAAQPSLTLIDLDRRLTEMQTTTGPGSTERRVSLLTDLLSRATRPEAELLRRLLTGELRQGALAGLMGDAIGRAASVPGDAASGRIIARLVELMNLPAVGPDNQPLSYKFHHKQSGRQIDDNESLEQAGVQDGDVLRLVAEITAG